MFEEEAAALLDIPFEKFTQVAMIPVAFSKGVKFKEAPRKDLADYLHIDSW